MDVKVEVKTEPITEEVSSPEVDWSIDTSKEGELGKSSIGSSWVYRGTYNKQQVAIKRVPIDEVEETKEDVRMSRVNHENVVKLLHVVENNLFKFFILEQCAASLQGFFDQEYLGRMPTDVQVLCQLSRGLDYIHSKGFVYRQIKPENILISSTTPIVMKLADFGLAKHSFSSSANNGSETFCWMAPEVLAKANGNETCVYSKESDIFSAGCVYFYFLTRAHPFGKTFQVKKNIMEGNIISLGRLTTDHFNKDVIIGMIAKEPENRITLAEVINGLIPQQLGPPATPSPPRYITDADITPISGLEEGINSGTIRARVVSHRELDAFTTQRGFTVRGFTMILRDNTGEVETSASGVNFKKFYQMFKVGRNYAIKRTTLKFKKNGERELTLRNNTIVKCL